MKTLLSILILLMFIKGVYAQTQNTNFGTSAGAQSKGTGNTFIGYDSGLSNNGSSTTAVGADAGEKNIGSGNAFFGSSAGVVNVGSGNVFFGSNTGIFNQADFVTAIGGAAGGLNKGSGAVFVGHNSGFRNQGLNNTAIGFNSGKSTMTGEHNTFLGALSGEKNTSGLHNTYIGVASGRNNLAGTYNTYLGMRAGEGSTGSNNVFIGYEAARTVTSSHKLVIAHNISSSTPLITGDFRARHVAIGGFGDPKFTLHVLGTAHTTGTFTSSDIRFKQKIQKIENASEKLLAVDGVSYEFKPDSTRNFHQGKTYGFIAQDVQKVLPTLVAADQEGYLALNYECFIPLLVEAFKEMKGEYQQLAQQNEALQKEVELLKRRLLRKPFPIWKNNGSSLKSIGHAADVPESDVSAMPVMVLHQNSPNPFNRQTSIRYEVAMEAQHIVLSIYDQSGILRLQYTKLAPGKGLVNIEAAQLPAGMYFYSLSVDGEVADTKRMILTQ